ncbi:MAG: hypothetical protein JXR73_18170 [Candidatus Omnitrophica bacterium]|nr:hypothetical protein [Candidatus Omnitrophota bacterium]
MLKRCCRLILMALIAACTFSESEEAAPMLNDPLAALERLSLNTETIRIVRDSSVDIPAGGHLQGVQAFCDPRTKRRAFFLSGSSNSDGYILTVLAGEGLQGEGRLVQCTRLPSDGQSPPLKHAGGFQILGDFLVAGNEDNEDRKRSEIQFWNLSDPSRPKLLPHLTIQRRSDREKIKTAGAVGIVKTAAVYWLAAASWDADTVDFYRSNSYPLSDDRCRFESEPVLHWSRETADREAWRPDQHFGNYQNINLLCDASQNLYLAGFERAAGGDCIDLFRLDVHQTSDLMLQKVASKIIPLSRGASFQYGGGFWIPSPGELIVLACGRSVREQNLGRVGSKRSVAHREEAVIQIVR